MRDASRKSKPPRPTFSVLLIPQSEDLWTAQCLELDIVAQGTSLTEAQQNLRCVIEDQAAIDQHYGREPLQGIPKAPPAYWDAWKEAVEIKLSKDAVEFLIPAVPHYEKFRVADRKIALG